MSGDFSGEQKRYLEGFVSGISAGRIAKPGAPAPAESEPMGPDAPHLAAQARAEKTGKKLPAEEKAKRDEHPFDMYARMKEAAALGEFPKGVDVFRWKFHGLFYVAPAQDSFMCRLRIANGILSHWQFAGVADIAERYGGGYADVTTRANLQVREIGPQHGIAVIEALQDIGLTARGTGADNIRNVTGSPTAGIGPGELYDTRPLARAWHHHILNDRTLYGLPRKFNVAFDGGGRVPVLEDTNDIGFQAVAIDEGAPVEPGLWFRLALGGITGHKDFARDTGIILRESECVTVADAIVRVFIENGDRTNRNKARLKYVLDDWGFEKFLAAVEDRLGRKLARVSPEHVLPRQPHDRFGHIGIHPQAQEGLSYIGLVLPVGRITVEQMRAIAGLARELGDGDIRLTVWQNLLLSGIPDEKLDDAKTRIEAMGLDWRASSVRAGLVACTGSRGCRFSAADTKGHAEAIARHCDAEVALDGPVNIHLTGCHNSCAQHYVGDIGLIGARVSLDEDSDETVDGYHVFVGGGFGERARIGRELFRDLPAEEAPRTVEKMLKAYLAHRRDETESFQDFTERQDIEALKQYVAEADA